MNRKLLLVFGLVLALLAVAANYVWKQQVIEQNDPGAMLMILAAKAPIKAGTYIEEGMLQSVQVPKRYAYQQSIEADRVKQIAGQPTRRDLEPGEQLSWFDFQSGEAAERLSDKIPKDARAVGVSVDPLSTLSGLLRPGDRVDIFAMIRHPTTGKVFTTSFQDDVPVLAVGGNMDRDQPNGEISAITLLMTRDQAAELRFIQRIGEIFFMVRNRKDDAAVVDIEFDVTRFIEAELKEAARVQRKAAPKTIITFGREQR